MFSSTMSHVIYVAPQPSQVLLSARICPAVAPPLFSPLSATLCKWLHPHTCRSMFGGRKMRMDVWCHFDYIKVENKSQCLLCEKKVAGKNTTHLKRHLRLNHENVKVSFVWIQSNTATGICGSSNSICPLSADVIERILRWLKFCRRSSGDASGYVLLKPGSLYHSNANC